ncbi:MAG: hypothetical protein H7331_09630 [Bacteroidia bacterium]|nr:hypothetical protein [Bacteroidia bacterium]
MFAIEKYDDEGLYCTFYTVRKEDAEFSETDKFLNKYKDNVKFKRSLQELFIFITNQIGNKHGALEEFFRFENNANALPPTGKHKIDEIYINYRNFPLRLYCLRISKNLVVLFNGAEKTSSTAQNGKTSMVFQEANSFSLAILEALKLKQIYITPNKREFVTFDNQDEIYL